MARRFATSLIVLAMLAGSLPAQAPLQPPAAPAPADPNLEPILRNWEKETTALQTMVVSFTCTYNINGVKKDYDGYAKFMALPDSKFGAVIHMTNKTNPQKYQRFVSSGNYLYSFRPEEKAIIYFPLQNRPQGQRPDDGVMAFLFGMKADEARRRYDLQVQRDDQHYTYLGVRPLFDRDKADFSWAWLAILKVPFPSANNPAIPAGLPKQIHTVEPNKTEVTWDLHKIQRNMPGTVDRTEFQQPKLPEGWVWRQGQNQPPVTPNAQ